MAGKLLRCPALILRRWGRRFHKILNIESPTLNQRMTKQVKQLPKYVPLDDTPSSFKDEGAIRGMTNRKAAGPDNVPAELIRVFLDRNQALLWRFHIIIIMSQTVEVPPHWKHVNMKVLFKKKDATECGDCRGIFVMAHAKCYSSSSPHAWASTSSARASSRRSKAASVQPARLTS